MSLGTNTILERCMMLGRTFLLPLPATDDDAVASNDNAGADSDESVGAEQDEAPAAGGADPPPRAAAAAMRDELMT